MKSFLLSLSLGMMFFLCIQGASASSFPSEKKGFAAVTHTKELILQVPGLTEKNLADIRSHVEASGGMQFAGYCKKLNVMMYIINVDMHPSTDFLSAAFSPLGLSYSVMQGASIAQVREECDLPAGGPSNTQSGLRAE